MLAYNPDERPSIEELLFHPWTSNECPSHEEVLQEFIVRKSINDDKYKEDQAKKI